MVDYTQFTYKIEFDGKTKRIKKYYHKERAVMRRYKKEKDKNPVMFFYQRGAWIGFDREFLEEKEMVNNE